MPKAINPAVNNNNLTKKHFGACVSAFLALANCDIRTIQELLGHIDLWTTISIFASYYLSKMAILWNQATAQKMSRKRKAFGKSIHKICG
jgi:site-specific recombinase XerC